MKKSTNIWAIEKYKKPLERSWKTLSNDDNFENITRSLTFENIQEPWNYTRKLGLSMKIFK